MGVVIRQSIKASISNYLGMGLGFLSLFLLFPLYFEPEELGAIRLLLEAGAVMSGFALLGTNYSINRFFPYFKTEDKKHHGFFFWAFAMPMLGFLLVLIGLLFWREGILSLFNKDAERLDGLYPLLLLLVLFLLFQQVSESCSANHGRIAMPNFFREVVVRIVQIASGLAFYWGWIGFYTAVALIVGAYLLAVLANLWFLGRLTRVYLVPDWHFLRERPELRKDILRFTGFLFVGGLASLLVTKIDFLMLSSMRRLSDTAIYSIGFYLAMMVEIPKRTLLQISAPIMAGHMKENRLAEAGDLYRKTTLNQVLAGTLLFYLIWLNIDNLYAIMPRGDYYSAGKWVVFILGFGRLVDALGAASGTVLVNSKYYHWAFFNFGLSAIVAITANYILIPKWGITGAAIATLLTITLNQIAALIIVYVKTGLHPFDKGKIWLLGIFIVMLLPTLTGTWFANPYLDGLIRTPVLGGALFYLVYALKVSEDMNHVANAFMRRVSGNRLNSLPLWRK
jgi:O-antigen/teichoic acid export membrane protein